MRRYHLRLDLVISCDDTSSPIIDPTLLRELNRDAEPGSLRIRELIRGGRRKRVKAILLDRGRR